MITIELIYFITRWQFQTEGNDIGFGLYRRTGDGRQKASEMEEIMRSERVNSHWVPEEGSHDCTQTGICTFVGHAKDHLSHSYRLIRE